MGTLNEILSFMYKMDKGYRETVNLNEDSNAYMFLVEDKRINQARQRSRDLIRNKFYYDYSRNFRNLRMSFIMTQRCVADKQCDLNPCSVDWLWNSDLVKTTEIRMCLKDF